MGRRLIVSQNRARQVCGARSTHSSMNPLARLLEFSMLVSAFRGPTHRSPRTDCNHFLSLSLYSFFFFLNLLLLVIILDGGERGGGGGGAHFYPPLRSSANERERERERERENSRSWVVCFAWMEISNAHHQVIKLC
jgi:hypothetical protein